jgi:predicted RNA-binding protein with TRAM domain
MIRKNHKPPVKEGEVLTIKMTGMGSEHAFVNYHGFIIFITNIKELSKEPITIQIITIKKTYCFAEMIKMKNGIVEL